MQINMFLGEGERSAQVSALPTELPRQLSWLSSNHPYKYNTKQSIHVCTCTCAGHPVCILIFIYHCYFVFIWTYNLTSVCVYVVF